MDNKQTTLPLVSVIIPTYNRVNVICEAIDSVAKQSYKNIEIIVVNDGSTDNTEEVVNNYINTQTQRIINPPIIKYFNKQNGGCSSARNFGIKEAKGDYLAFLDSDDLWYPNKLEKQIKALITNTDYGLSISNIEFINENKEHVSFSNLRKSIIKDGDILEYILRMPRMTCSYIVARKDVFSEVGLFDETFKTANDFDMILRICNKFKTVLIEDSLVRYKKSNNSVSHKLFSRGRLMAVEKFKRYAPIFVNKNKRLISKTIAKICLDYGEDLLWNRYIKEAQKQLKQSLCNRVSLKAILLYGKSLLMQCFSLFNSKFKDKGKFYAE